MRSGPSRVAHVGVFGIRDKIVVLNLKVVVIHWLPAIRAK